MRDEQILALYEWAPGSCFRCARSGVDVARISAIDTPSGARYDVHACQDCVAAMEAARRRQAERLGREPRPGRLGKPEA